MSLQDKLNKLKYSLNLDVLNLRNIQRQINEIQTFKEEQNYDYLKGLLCPEKSQGIRIPSQIPQPTSCFQWRNTYTFKPNAKGSYYFVLNPFFLYNESAIGKTIPFAPAAGGGNVYQWYIAQYVSSFWPCNDANLDGESEYNVVTAARDIQQSVPDLYNNYRLVSASLILKYIGPLDEAQGVIGGGIDYTVVNRLGGRFYQYQGQPYDPTAASYGMNTNKFAKYTNFDNIRHLTYSTENNVLEGLRLLYFPTDNKSDCFIKTFNGEGAVGVFDAGNFCILPLTDQYKTGFTWVCYVQDANPDSNYRIDITCNFEAIPNAKYLNYIPVSVRPYYLPWKERKLILDELKDHVVQKNN